jgi:K(+)-stimulated pyrophosphate-energized sodium pump
LDSSVWFLGLYFLTMLDLPHISVILLSAAMGASTQALFARVGGGIYTKAADVGADLVGKVEAGIPEDDPRNPATIADNVGDNVGDVAGMGADLYESYVGSMRAAVALGIAAVAASTIPEGMKTSMQLRFLTAPMAIAAIGVILSLVGIYMVRTKEDATVGDLMGALIKSITASSVLIAIAAIPIIWLLELPWVLLVPVITGLIVGEAIGRATEYYTSDEHPPTQGIAAQAGTGPATVIIEGLAVGMRSTGIPVLAIVVGISLSFYATGGIDNPLMGLYGVGLAAISMLSTLGLTLATDAYGPIAGCSRQHHSRYRQGLCHRLGGPDSTGFVSFLPGTSPGQPGTKWHCRANHQGDR